jgi:hypothetical protein
MTRFSTKFEFDFSRFGIARDEGHRKRICRADDPEKSKLERSVVETFFASFANELAYIGRAALGT